MSVPTTLTDLQRRHVNPCVERAASRGHLPPSKCAGPRAPKLRRIPIRTRPHRLIQNDQIRCIEPYREQACFYGRIFSCNSRGGESAPQILGHQYSEFTVARDDESSGACDSVHFATSSINQLTLECDLQTVYVSLLCASTTKFGRQKLLLSFLLFTRNSADADKPARHV